jgi:hypothetical protein
MKPPEVPPPDDDIPIAPRDSENGNEPLGDAQIQKWADDRFVHALLVGRFQDTPETASQRVARVCSAFEKSVGARRWYWRAGLSTAAAAVLLVGLAVFFWPAQSVQAQLRQVLDTFDVGDKTYQIDISEDTDPPAPDARKSWTHPLRRPAFKPARGRAVAKRLDGALLYVRNRKQVLTYTLPSGRKIARGLDEPQSWIAGPPTRSNTFGSPARPWRRLPAGSDPNLLREEIPEAAVSLLLLDLRDMLHQLRKHYTVSRPSRSPSQEGTTSVWYVVADRVTPRARLPRRLELWVEAETGQIHDILCTGVSFHRSAPRYALRITLLESAPLAPDWFTPQAHLSGE